MKNEDSYTCCYCNNQLKLQNFYKSNSELYINLGHLPICKKCLTKLYSVYVIKYQDRKKAWKRLCMAFDLYYNEKIFERCGDDESSFIGNYVRNLNLSQSKSKSFESSINEKFNFDEFSDNTDNKNDENKSGNTDNIDPQLKAKWGSGFTKSEFEELEAHYNMLRKSNPDINNNQLIFINTLSKLHVFMSRANRANDLDAYAKANDQYLKTFTKAGFKAEENINIDQNDSWGKWNMIVEKYVPSEYYKNKELYKNHDGLHSYIERFLKRPFKNLMCGTKERDTEFYVKEDDLNE